MKALYLSVFLIAVSLSANLRAGTHKLVTITNDIDSYNVHFFLVTDEENEEIQAFLKKDYLNGKVTETKTYPVPDSSSAKFKLLKQSGRDVVVLESQNFSLGRGGDVIIDYLNNGITKKRKNIMTQLVRAGKGWELVDRQQRPIDGLHFVSKTILGKVVGVDHVDVTLK